MSGPNRRFGAQRWGETVRPSPYHAAITANMAVPTVALQSIRAPEFDQIEWAIEKPAGVVTYDVLLWRWREHTKSAYGAWILESSSVGLSADAILLQDVRGTGVYAQITNIAGVIGVGFAVLVTPLNGE